MTTSENMKLFQQALWEATGNVYDRELAECTEDAKCSRRHYAKMRRILGVAVLPATTRTTRIKRRVIAALVAAVLLLTGCTVYAYREKIRTLMETIFDNHVEVKYNEGEELPTEATISEYYTLGYVPEGYELTKTYQRPIYVKYEWTNSEDIYITFEQCHVDSGLFVMDNEIEGWDVVQIGECKVHHRISDAYYYLWNDGVYAYRLTTSELWEEQVLRDMIENLRIKE